MRLCQCSCVRYIVWKKKTWIRNRVGCKDIKAAKEEQRLVECCQGDGYLDHHGLLGGGGRGAAGVGVGVGSWRRVRRLARGHGRPRSREHALGAAELLRQLARLGRLRANQTNAPAAGGVFLRRRRGAKQRVEGQPPTPNTCFSLGLCTVHIRDRSAQPQCVHSPCNGKLCKS